MIRYSSLGYTAGSHCLSINSLHLLTPNSKSLPLSPPSSWQPQVCSPWIGRLKKIKKKGCNCGMQKFLGQESNPCHSSDPSQSHDSAGSLTTRPPGIFPKQTFKPMSFSYLGLHLPSDLCCLTAENHFSTLFSIMFLCWLYTLWAKRLLLDMAPNSWSQKA